MKKQLPGLLLVLSICALLVAVTHAMTRDTIAQNQLRQQQALLRELLPEAIFPDPLVWNHHQLALCTTTSVNRVTTRGYGGEIQLLVAFEDDLIRGVRVISHNETPGLGDFIERSKSSWISLFGHRAAGTLDANIDKVTGATITRNALVRAVEAAIILEPWPCT